MHELALTEGILSIVSSEQKKSGFSRVLEIDLCIGEYSGVIPSCIEEFFPLAAKETAAENARLVMKPVKAEFECRACGFRGPLEKHGASLRFSGPSRKARGQLPKLRQHGDPDDGRPGILCGKPDCRIVSFQ